MDFYPYSFTDIDKLPVTIFAVCRVYCDVLYM